MSERLPRLPPREMTEAQRAVHEAIASGPRAAGPRDFPVTHEDGSLVGPFNALAMVGELGFAVQSVGEAIRYHGVLDPHCRELAILMVAVAWRADFEWYAHERVARRVGLNDTVIAAVRRGEVPVLEDAAMAATHAVTAELLESRELADSTHAAAEAALGRDGLIELTALIGYYILLALILNAFDVGLPEPVPSPFGRY